MSMPPSPRAEYKGTEAATEHWRAQLHFTPRRHWINDPNGLIWLPNAATTKDPVGVRSLGSRDPGTYHLYYQHNPFGNEWGHMSWGHATSTDLLHWTEHAVAIPEDDRVSIFSGSMVLDRDNTSGLGDGMTAPLVAIYTGCLRRPEGGQAQELAYSLDGGYTFTKFADNPVLDLGLRDFRDPKVFWHAPSSRWVMAVVLPDARQVIFYASNNLRAWNELSRFESDLANQGIWECPDLVELPIAGEPGRTAWMLKVDVFEGHPSQGSGARLFVGDFDGTAFTAHAQQPSPWADHGADFYAALSWSNLEASPEPSRRVWLGWMSCHRYAKHVPTKPWRGAMSLPRELCLQRRRDGALALQQRVVREWDALRGPCVIDETQRVMSAGQTVDHSLPLDVAAHGALDIEWTVTTDHATTTGDVMATLRLAGRSNAASWSMHLDLRNGRVQCLRAGPGALTLPDDALYAAPRVATVRVLGDVPAVSVRLLVDRSSVECFLDDGETVLTEQWLPTEPIERITVHAFRGATVHGLRVRGMTQRC